MLHLCSVRRVVFLTGWGESGFSGTTFYTACVCEDRQPGNMRVHRFTANQLSDFCSSDTAAQQSVVQYFLGHTAGEK